MMFSELYSAYYNVMAAILKNSIDHKLQREEFLELISKYAFAESSLNIEPKIREEKWQIIKSDGSTPIKNPPTMPLTMLQRRWLKTISLDPRIKLFAESFLVEELKDIEPLFYPEDIVVFDRFSDGDNYADEAYVSNFRTILDAVWNKYPLRINFSNQKGKTLTQCVVPDYLEYSEKDDKFRLVGHNSQRVFINIGRIVNVRRITDYEESQGYKTSKGKKRSVRFELYDSRKALERVLLHFAHFEKEARHIEADKYEITVFYDKDDETEILIRVLSFGPRVKVIAPDHFVELIKERLIKQKEKLMLNN